MDSLTDTPRGVGCPIRRSRDQRALAPPPSLSQRATSFIASRCQGIHQTPFSSNHRPRPAPSPRRRRRRRREQTTEDRGQTRHRRTGLASVSAPCPRSQGSRNESPPKPKPRRITSPAAPGSAGATLLTHARATDTRSRRIAPPEPSFRAPIREHDHTTSPSQGRRAPRPHGHDNSCTMSKDQR